MQYFKVNAVVAIFCLKHKIHDLFIWIFIFPNQILHDMFLGQWISIDIVIDQKSEIWPKCRSHRQQVLRNTYLLGGSSPYVSCHWVLKIYKYRIMYELVWITIFVTSEAIRQLFIAVLSHQLQKIHANECIILFFTRYLMLWANNSAKNSTIAHFAMTAKDGLFWLSIVT